MPFTHVIRHAGASVAAVALIATSHLSRADAQTQASPIPTTPGSPKPTAPAAPAMTPTPAAAGGPAAPGHVPSEMFGEPPSGGIPIMYNDQHVYTKPDDLRHRRVLAALVEGDEILVPLRSMFEQMGARVSYNPNSHVVDISKPGTDIQLTIGKRSVTINGQESPLDVPAEFYQGVIVVPVRVISEGMGAYVQWVPDQHVVVVRYEAAPPAAVTPGPVMTPTAVPTPATTPAPAQPGAPHLEKFVGGDYIVSPRVYNELSPGNEGRGSFDINGAIEFVFLGPQWDLGGDYRHVRYDHNAFGAAPAPVPDDPIDLAGPCLFGLGGQACVTVPGASRIAAIQGSGQAFVPTFTAGEDTIDVHVGVKVADPHVYIAVAYYRKNYDYLGYPTIGGLGAGLEKLPDLGRIFSLYGSAWYFPDVSGTYHYQNAAALGPLSGAAVKFGYSAVVYDGGGAFSFGKTSGAFVRAGFRGERLNGKSSAPSGTSVAAPYVGVGVHF